MTEHQKEEPQETSPDQRSESTKKWVERRQAAYAAKAGDDVRVSEEARRWDEEAQAGYHNPKGVWIGLALVIALVAAGWWVIDSLRCDPLESDLALVKSDACR
jgi:sensor c-di-GMP phosphodiesterase-like protein